MEFLAPVVLISWIFISIYIFLKFPHEKAIIIVVFGGVLLLPVYSIDPPGFPVLTKNALIGIAVISGQLTSKSATAYPFKMKSYDIPMFLWCFVSPMATSLSNGLGIMDGFAVMISNFLMWGTFYWAGRRYFLSIKSFQNIPKGFIIGGLLYIPLILYELRMSPRINRMIYGFFVHSWRQHFRYGGYRPIVFMEHGIQVALFMAAATSVFFWLWKTGEIKKIKNIPAKYFGLLFIIVTIFCRTAAGWVFLFIGIVFFYIYKKKGSVWMIRMLLMLVPLYLVVRITNLLSREAIENTMSLVFDEERVASLGWRLLQEDLFGERALIRPIAGWGGYGRAWPVDPYTGEELIPMVDPLWVILFGWYGLLGLSSVFTALGLGPGLAMKYYSRYKFSRRVPIATSVAVISLIVVFFMVDLLVNAMVNPVYILCAGALVSHYEALQNETPSMKMLEHMDPVIGNSASK